VTHIHADLAAGRWHTLPLLEQLAHVGSDVGRAARWYGKDPQRCEQAFLRALELLDLTIADARWEGRRKELVRVQEPFSPAAATPSGLCLKRIRQASFVNRASSLSL